MGAHKFEAYTEPLYKCPDCDEIVKGEDVDESNRMYECGECGEVFSRENSANYNHQCPECNRFAARLQDASGIACPECEGAELEAITGFICTECDEVFENDNDPRGCSC